MTKKYKLFDMIKTMQEWITEFPYLWGKDFLKYGFEEVSEPVKERIKVDAFLGNGTDSKNGMRVYCYAVSQPIQNEQFPAIKKAIEDILNDTVVEDNASVWTDAFVREAVESMIRQYAYGKWEGFENEFEAFKQSKQSSPIPTNKEWEIVAERDRLGRLYYTDMHIEGNKIEAVRRLSDNVVFSVGDKLNGGYSIEKFEIEHELGGIMKICLNEGGFFTVENCPLHTTPTQPIVEDKEWEWNISDGATIKEVIGEAIGGASLCWNPTPTGVFDSTIAAKIADRVINYIQEQMDKAIEDAFNAAREIHPIMGDGANLFAQRVRMAALFSTLQDYINHLKQNK